MIQDPQNGQSISIDGRLYDFIEAPDAPGILYAEIGRKAKVYCLVSGGKSFALKVFQAAFRSPEIVVNASRIGKFQDVPGLAVACRTIMQPANYPQIIQANPSFAYSILMPWVEGKSWFNYMSGKIPLTKRQSLRLACSLTSTLSELEARHLAHCDLSGSNFIFSPDFSHVELIDIEDMFGNGLLPPQQSLKGTEGYAPGWTLDHGIWEAAGDRFAVGILVSEILGWQFDEVRNAAVGDSFFADGEFGHESKRFHLLNNRIEQIHPELASLFRSVWYSESFEDCPRVGDWKKILFGNADFMSGSDEIDLPASTIRIGGRQSLAPSQGVSAISPTEVVETSPDIVPDSVRLPNETPVITYSIIGLTTIVYILQIASVFLFGYANDAAQLDWLEVLGANLNQAIRAGEIWRFFTPVLLHADVLHILFNMSLLFFFGRYVERYYGRLRFFLLYLLAGFSGNAFSFLFTDGYSIGAATSILGLLGANAILLIRNKKTLGSRIRPQYSFFLGITIAVTAALLIMGLVLTGIDNAGDLGGWVGGLIFAWFAGPLLDIQDTNPATRLVDKRKPYEIRAGVLAVILIFGVLIIVDLFNPTIFLH